MGGEVARFEAPREAKAFREPQPSRAEPGALPPVRVPVLSASHVAGLQRLAGNAGVARLLQPARRPVVQRCGPDHPDCGCEPDRAGRDPRVTPVQRSAGPEIVLQRDSTEVEDALAAGDGGVQPAGLPKEAFRAASDDQRFRVITFLLDHPSVRTDAVIPTVWDGFGPNLENAVAARPAEWERSLEEKREITSTSYNFQGLRKIFFMDVQHVVEGYLAENDAYCRQELTKLGLDEHGRIVIGPPTKELATAGGTNVVADTALVTRGQVDEAKAELIEKAAFAFLDVAGGISAAHGALKEIVEFEKQAATAAKKAAGLADTWIASQEKVASPALLAETEALATEARTSADNAKATVGGAAPEEAGRATTFSDNAEKDAVAAQTIWVFNEQLTFVSREAENLAQKAATLLEKHPVGHPDRVRVERGLNAEGAAIEAEMQRLEALQASGFASAGLAHGVHAVASMLERNVVARANAIFPRMPRPPTGKCVAMGESGRPMISGYKYNPNAAADVAEHARIIDAALVENTSFDRGIPGQASASHSEKMAGHPRPR